MKRRDSLLHNIIPIIPVIIVGIPIIILRRRLSAVLAPIAAAALLAYMLNPAVDFTQKLFQSRTRVNRRARRGDITKAGKGMTRSGACAVVFSVFIILIIAAASLLIPAIARSIADIIENEDVIKEKLMSCAAGIVPAKYTSLRENVISLAESLCGFIDKRLTAASAASASVSSYGKISDFAVGIISTIIITYYFLRDKTAILNGIYGLFPYRWRGSLSAAADELGMISAKFIQGQLLVACIIGIIETVGLLIIGVPYAVLLGFIGGLSNMVPYFGPFIGALPPVFTALMISPVKAVWVAVLFLAVQQLDNQLLSPKIIEGNLGIHPVTIIIIVFIGEEFFGLWGIIAAVPVYAMIKCILTRIIKACRCPDQL